MLGKTWGTKNIEKQTSSEDVWKNGWLSHIVLSRRTHQGSVAFAAGRVQLCFAFLSTKFSTKIWFLSQKKGRADHLKNVKTNKNLTKSDRFNHVSSNFSQKSLTNRCFNHMF